jgi:nicotinamidase-related amidase
MNPARRTGPRALLLLDFQRDFLAENGRMPVARHQVSPVLAAARRAADRAARDGDLVVLVGNEFRRGDVVGNLVRRRAAVAGSSGTVWDERIHVHGAPYFAKHAGSAFTNTALGAALDDRGIRHVTIAGLFAQGCVRATARGALRRGMTVDILRDAVACASDRSRDRALTLLAARGAHLTSVDAARTDA